MRLLYNDIPALLIGSTAAQYWWPQLRDPVDCDVYCSDAKLSEELEKAGMQVQVATARNGILGFVERAATCPTVRVSGVELPIASPQLLLTIKAVHINYPNKFKKNIHDYLALRRLVQEEPIKELIAARMRHLDAITLVSRNLATPDGFWDVDLTSRACLLESWPLREWCIYASSARLRRFVQDNYRELRNAEDRAHP